MMASSTSRGCNAVTHFLLGVSTPIVERLREWSKKLRSHEEHDGSNPLNDLRNIAGPERFDNRLRLIFDSIPALIHIARPGAALHDERHFHVTVQDSGPGLDPTQSNRLFEAFYSTKPGGLGMGLAISRSIIEAHDGRLWATTNEDRGATFHFTLPIGEERPA